MDAGALRDLLTLLAGVVTGVLSGAFGVGGATISTPAVRALGLPALLSVGTTLPSILPGAISGTMRYSREDLVDWRLVRWTAPVGVVSAVAGALLSRVVPGEGHLLMVITSILLGVAVRSIARGPQGAIDSPRARADESEAGLRRRDRPALLLSVGAAAGLLSGLLGLGGGVVMVPGFTEWLRMPLKPAIATSLVCVGIFAVPGTVTHAALGGIDWRFALVLALGVVPGARLGAVAAIRTSDAHLRMVVAGLLGLVAALYFVSETAALVRG